jgi:hypothetical protein
MHSSEDAAPEGAMAGRSRRRILPAALLLALILACAWLSAIAFGQTHEAGFPTGGKPTQGIASPERSAFANELAPTDRPGSTNPVPGDPDVLVAPPASPSPLPTKVADEEPQATLETPTATPVTPTAAPVTPTATPVTPTATPVTPTATPVTPTATPVTPTATPVTPTATPVTPTPTPVCSGNTPDAYEADNNYTQAQVISTDGVPQCHDNAKRVEVVNGTPAAIEDEDWVKFNAVSGHGYKIGTQLLNDINQSDTAANDTLLYLYATDGMTQLAFNDDVGSRTDWYLTPPYSSYHYRESLIRWTAPADGQYYVRELQWGPTAGYSIRDYHWYELWVLDLDASTSEPLAEIPASPEAMSPTPETPTEVPAAATETPTEEPEAPTETPTEEQGGPSETPTPGP